MLRYQKVLIGLSSTLLLMIALACWGVMQLTDARLTRWTREGLNKHLSGRFDVGRVHYAFPVHISIDDVRARSPRGVPVLSLAHLQVDARLAPLLLRRMIVEQVLIDGMRVDIASAGQGGMSEFVSAFIPDFELPALRDIATPIRVELQRLRLEHGDVMVKGMEGAQARLTDMRVHDANAWMDGDLLRANLTWETTATAQAGEAQVDASHVEARIQDARVHFADADFAVQALTAEFPGFDADVGGGAQLDRDADMQAHVHGDITLDTDGFLPKVHRLDALKKTMHGHGTLHFEGQHKGQAGEATMTLKDPNMQVQWLPLKTFSLSVSHDKRDINLKAFRLGLGEGNIEGHGTLSLGQDGNILVGEHNVSLKAHAMEVREMARPWVALPGLLPQAVSFAVVSKGRALWPPTSQVDVDVVPEGLPGEDWPGLPKAMELRGRFLTHPDLLEILKLEAYIDNAPDFGIQGAVPLHEQSVLDIIHELHGPHPKGPLRRMPMAPTNKRP